MKTGKQIVLTYKIKILWSLITWSIFFLVLNNSVIVYGIYLNLKIFLGEPLSLNVFVPSAIQWWNSLPINICLSPSLAIVKRYLLRYLFPTPVIHLILLHMGSFNIHFTRDYAIILAIWIVILLLALQVNIGIYIVMYLKMLITVFFCCAKYTNQIIQLFRNAQNVHPFNCDP